MEVQLLTKTITTAAETFGYHVIVGDVAQCAAHLSQLPALCIARPTLRDKRGQRSGWVVYRVECNLMQSAEAIDLATDDDSANELETQQLQQLYNHALAVIEAVDALDEVCEVACVSSIPSKGRQTPCGDIALKLVFDVKLKFQK